MVLVGLFPHFRDLRKSVMESLAPLRIRLSMVLLPRVHLAGITGSASGGMGIALSAMADKYNQRLQLRIFHLKLCTVSSRWHQVGWIRFRITELLLPCLLLLD